MMRRIVFAALILLAPAAFFAGVWYGQLPSTERPTGLPPPALVPSVPASPITHARPTPTHLSERVKLNARIAEGGADALREMLSDDALAQHREWLRSLAVLVYPELLDAALLDALDIDSQQLSGYVMLIARSDTNTARHLATLADDPERQQLMQMVERIAEQFQELGDPQAAFREALASSEEPNQRIGKLMMSLQAIARDNPATAAMLLAEVPADSGREILAQQLVSAWAQQDPAAAARWAAGQDGALRRVALKQAAQIWARTDLEAASQFAASLAASERRTALAAVAGALADQPKETVTRWLDVYATGEARPSIIAVASVHLASLDSRLALEMAAELPNQTRQIVTVQVLQQLAMRAPDEALQRLELLEPQARPGFESIIVSTMAMRDPQRALGYVREQPAGRHRDTLYSALVQGQPSAGLSAARDLLEQIDDAGVRKNALVNVLQRSTLSDEAVALAREYGLTEEELDAVRTNQDIGGAVGGVSVRRGSVFVPPRS